MKWRILWFLISFNCFSIESIRKRLPNSGVLCIFLDKHFLLCRNDKDILTLNGDIFSYIWDRADLDTTKEFTSTRNQMCASDTSRNTLQSCLVLHSILYLLQKTFFEANFNSSYDIILSYLVKNSTQRNMKRSGEKRIGAGREKSLSFTKITKEINQ